MPWAAFDRARVYVLGPFSPVSPAAVAPATAAGRPRGRCCLENRWEAKCARKKNNRGHLRIPRSGRRRGARPRGKIRPGGRIAASGLHGARGSTPSSTPVRRGTIFCRLGPPPPYRRDRPCTSAGPLPSACAQGKTLNRSWVRERVSAGLGHLIPNLRPPGCRRRATAAACVGHHPPSPRGRSPPGAPRAADGRGRPTMYEQGLGDPQRTIGGTRSNYDNGGVPERGGDSPYLGGDVRSWRPGRRKLHAQGYVSRVPGRNTAAGKLRGSAQFPWRPVGHG